MMFSVLCFAGALSTLPLSAPSGLILNANTAWYKEAKSTETALEGVVQRTPTTGRVGLPTRFNAFQFSWTDATGQNLTREIHAPDKAHLLGDYIEQRVRLVGKLVDTDVDGKTYQELWPARLHPFNRDAQSSERSAHKDGVLARTAWQPPNALRAGVLQLVIRDGTALAKHMRVSGDEGDRAASALMAKRLNVQSIDWDKQMLICVAAGLKTTEGDRLAITRVAVKDKELIVTYRLLAPEGGATGFGYPAQTALVERFNGVVRFEEEKDAGK
jgi:hypothetical protein